MKEKESQLDEKMQSGDITISPPKKKEEKDV